MWECLWGDFKYPTWIARQLSWNHRGATAGGKRAKVNKLLAEGYVLSKKTLPKWRINILLIPQSNPSPRATSNPPIPPHHHRNTLLPAPLLRQHIPLLLTIIPLKHKHLNNAKNNSANQISPCNKVGLRKLPRLNSWAIFLVAPVLRQ